MGNPLLIVLRCPIGCLCRLKHSFRPAGRVTFASRGKSNQKRLPHDPGLRFAQASLAPVLLHRRAPKGHPGPLALSRHPASKPAAQHLRSASSRGRFEVTESSAADGTDVQSRQKGERNRRAVERVENWRRVKATRSRTGLPFPCAIRRSTAPGGFRVEDGLRRIGRGRVIRC